MRIHSQSLLAHYPSGEAPSGARPAGVIVGVLACLLIAMSGCGSDKSTSENQTPRLLRANAGVGSYSPDGRAIACVQRADTLARQWFEVWGVPLDGRPAYSLIRDSTGATFPLWLPDGQRIVYYHTKFYPTGPAGEFVVYRMGTGPVAKWRVAALWDDPGMCLSPDGSEVFFSTTQRQTWALNLTTGATRLLVDKLGGTVSPDGHWIAFVSEGDTITVAPVGGGVEHKLGSGWYLAWTPDSRSVVFTGRSALGQSDIMIAGRDGSSVRQLTHDGDLEFYKCVSPSGRQIAYVRAAGEFDTAAVWLLDLPGQAFSGGPSVGRLLSAGR